MPASYGGQQLVHLCTLLFVRDVVSGKDMVMTRFVTKNVTFSELVAPRIVTRKELGYLLSIERVKQKSDSARQKFGSGV